MGICGSRHSVVNAVTDTNKQVEEHKTKEVSIIKSHQNAGGHSGEEKAPGSPVRGGWTDTEKPLKVNHEDEVQAFDQDFNDDSDKPKNISPSKSGLNARIFGSGSAAGGQLTTGASPVGTPKMKIGKGKGGEAWKSSLRKGADDIEPFEAPLNAIVPPASGSNTSNAVSRACFGAGCYWGTEHYFRQRFGENIVKGAVGFMGPQGAPANPSYEEVCNGGTGHVEVFDMEFNGGIEVFREMCRYFFQIHDPTTLNRQGNDRGTQYASVIYAQDAEYFEVAVSTKDEVQKLVNAKKITSYQSVRVSTAVHLRTIFYRAKEEHQLYLDRHPDGYCNHRVRFNEWPSIDK